MRRIAPGAVTFIAALLLACGSDDGANTTQQQLEPTSQPNRHVSGPTVSVEPRSGPPGTEVTVTGVGWPSAAAVDVTGELTRGATGEPYASTTTDESGTFTVTFRLETAPDGGELQVGPYPLTVHGAGAMVDLLFLVETPRPVQNRPPGG